MGKTIGVLAILIFSVRANEVKLFNYTEPSSHYDISKLEKLCNSKVPLWSFSASDNQKPLLTDQSIEECFHRLKYHLFIWTPVHLFNITPPSVQHALIVKSSQLKMISLDQTKELEPLFEPDQDCLIELAKRDDLEEKITINRKKLLRTELINEETLRFGKAKKREVCIDFNGPAKAALNRDHNMHYDICIKDIRGSFEQMRRNMPLYPGNVKKVLLKWSVDLEIQLKSGPIETTVTVPANVYDCTISYDGGRKQYDLLYEGMNSTQISTYSNGSKSKIAMLSLPVLLLAYLWSLIQ